MILRINNDHKKSRNWKNSINMFYLRSYIKKNINPSSLILTVYYRILKSELSTIYDRKFHKDMLSILCLNISIN